MRRATKLMAALLVLTCAMTMAPKRAEASIWNSIIDLTTGEIPPGRLMVANDTGRPVRIRMWSNHGDYEKRRLEDGQLCGFAYDESDGTWFAVEAAVWNKNTKKYVVMDYVEGPAYQDYIFYKHAQGDFRLSIWGD